MTPEIAPPVVKLKALEERAKVPVEFPIAVLAVPVVLMFAAPKTFVVEAELPMATEPVEEPVLILVLLLEEALIEVVAPEIVAPPVP